MPAKGSHKPSCIHGHDTSLPNSRTPTGCCKACKRTRYHTSKQPLPPHLSQLPPFTPAQLLQIDYIRAATRAILHTHFNLDTWALHPLPEPPSSPSLTGHGGLGNPSLTIKTGHVRPDLIWPSTP